MLMECTQLYLADSPWSGNLSPKSSTFWQNVLCRRQFSAFADCAPSTSYACPHDYGPSAPKQLFQVGRVRSDFLSSCTGDRAPLGPQFMGFGGPQTPFATRSRITSWTSSSTESSFVRSLKSYLDGVSKAKSVVGSRATSPSPASA